MPYESRHAVRSLAINASTWTDISGKAVLPIDCHTIVIFNNTGVTILFRSDPGNANSQVSIGNGQQYEINGSVSQMARGPRFPAGSDSPVGALLSSSGNVSPLIESTL